MSNVRYMLDFMEKNETAYNKHKQLYTKCYEHERQRLGLYPKNPTEAELDALEAEFIAAYNKTNETT